MFVEMQNSNAELLLRVVVTEEGECLWLGCEIAGASDQVKWQNKFLLGGLPHSSCVGPAIGQTCRVHGSSNQSQQLAVRGHCLKSDLCTRRSCNHPIHPPLRGTMRIRLCIGTTCHTKSLSDGFRQITSRNTGELLAPFRTL